MIPKLKTVISGSFKKHLQEIGNALENFRKAEVNVLAPLATQAVNGDEDFVFLTTDNPEKSADVLEKEFLANIKEANFLYLANIGGYVGQSAATEIGVAVTNGVPVVATEEIADFSEDIPSEAQEFLRTKVFRQLPINEIAAEKIAKLNLSSFTPVNLSESEQAILQSLITKLLNDLKNAKLTA